MKLYWSISKKMYILRNDIYQNRKKIISFCIGGVAYTLLLTYFWTLFSDTFGQMLDLFPDAMKAIVGFGDDLSVTGFLNGEFMHLIGPLIIGAFGITIGSSSIATEESNKTIDQILTLSISRTRFYIEKYLALVFCILLLAIIIAITLGIGSLIFNFDIGLINLLYAAIALFSFGLCTGSISFSIGAITGKRSIAASITAFIAIAGYVFDSIYTVVDKLDFTRYIALHYYYNSNAVIQNGVNSLHILVILLLIIISFIIGLYVFYQRDIKS